MAGLKQKQTTLIFPTQLFEKHPALSRDRAIYLAEEFLFFREDLVHKQKLVLLRAAMKAYADWLSKRGFYVIYVESGDLRKRGALFEQMGREGVRTVHLADFPDHRLMQDLKKAAKRHRWELHFYPSPMFLCSEEEIKGFFRGKKHYFMASFYIDQRRKFNLLMKEGAPLGGKFSFDPENRKPLPKGCKVPKPYLPIQNHWVEEAVDYVEKEFPNALGEISHFFYPVTFTQAKKALSDFIENRLRQFGDYEDAIKQDEPLLFHSRLSPLLNIGLLTPKEVVRAALSSYKKARLPLNSVEGFIRQVIGWREFIRASYVLKGKAQRRSNYFRHRNRVPRGFWTGEVGIEPVDRTIKKVLSTGYCHHIERLMILGNFLLLAGTHPNAVYAWFMGHFIDAYDWVMVPNIYGMSQYADGGGMTSKPYISGSNYIVKMSDYSRGAWADIWDGLFWRFISQHRTVFAQNPRTKVLLSLLKKNSRKIEPKIRLAEKWLVGASVHLKKSDRSYTEPV